MSQQVLHLDFIALSQAAGPSDREHLLKAAAQLSVLPQVQSLGAIEADPGSQSDFDLVFYFLLSDFAALEPFGTDSRYASFLQGAVAPRLKAFAGADVRLEADFQAGGEYAACAALLAPDETYDWEVRDTLQAWCGTLGGGTSDVGLAVGEKQLYRGAALAFGPTPLRIDNPQTSQLKMTQIAGNARTLA